MKPFIVRYYADWTQERICSRVIHGVSFEAILDSLEHFNTPVKRNTNLLIDIQEVL